MADPILVIDLATPFIGHESVTEWYVGETVDHVYPNCPALTRSGLPPRRGQGRLYPNAGDVCGWCVHVWRARKTRAATLAVLDDTGGNKRKDEPMQVITTDASDRYHASEDCAAFQAGRQGSEAHGYTLHEIRTLPAADAEAEGKTPCPACVQT